jgi:hypothetical protein
MRTQPSVFLVNLMLAVLAIVPAVGRAAESGATDIPGTFILTITDPRRSGPAQWVCEIAPGTETTPGTVMVDQKTWGAWTLDDDAFVVRAVPPRQGEVRLRKRGAGGLVGQHVTDQGTAKWSLERVQVVSRWIHQAGNDRPREIRFWSTGAVDAPDGRVKWSINPQKRELLLRWPMTTDRCRLSPDGLRYEGRNENGTLITGRQVVEP